jgi:hypothetical protein
MFPVRQSEQLVNFTCYQQNFQITVGESDAMLELVKTCLFKTLSIKVSQVVLLNLVGV